MIKKKIKKVLKKRTKKAAPRARRVLKRLLVNRGKESVGRIMKEEGYSEAYAKNPKQFLETKAYLDLLDKVGLDDMTIAKKHKELLEAGETKFLLFNHGMSDEKIRAAIESLGYVVASIEEVATPYEDQKTGKTKIVKRKQCMFLKPDYQIQDKALDKILKIKGRYAPIKLGGVVKHVLTDEERAKIDDIFDE